MSQLPPELRVEIRKIDGQYLAVTERANGQEICTHTFTHDPAKLIHVEPGWMLEKGARAPEQSLRAQDEAADRPPTTSCSSPTASVCTATCLATGTPSKTFSSSTTPTVAGRG